MSAERQEGVDHLQHAVVDEEIVVQAGAADGMEGIFHGPRGDQGRVDVGVAALLVEGQGDHAGGAGAEVQAIPFAERRDAERAVADQGDLSQRGQGLGDGGAVFLGAADEVPGVVVDGDARPAQAQQQLAAVDGVAGGGRAGAQGRFGDHAAQPVRVGFRPVEQGGQRLGPAFAVVVLAGYARRQLVTHGRPAPWRRAWLRQDRGGRAVPGSPLPDGRPGGASA